MKVIVNALLLLSTDGVFFNVHSHNHLFTPNEQVLTFVFFAFVTAKRQSQFAAVSLNRLNESLIENAQVNDISIAESESLEVIPEPLKETPSQKPGVKHSNEDVQKAGLLLAITPDGACVGINVKYGMPESFDTEQSRQEWHEKAGDRAIDLKDQIESGACSVESVKDKLNMKPNIPAAMIEKLVSRFRAGLCFGIFLYFFSRMNFI